MAKQKNGLPQKVEYQFPQPKEKVSFAHMIYNPNEGTFFGRTIKSWSQLFLFYLIFYIVLAGLFAISMQGLFKTLEDDRPKWTLDSSIIGTNPGLGFRPLNEETEYGSIIQYNLTKPEQYKKWIEMLDEFLIPYNTTKNLNEGKNRKYCSFDTKLGVNDVCTVRLQDFGPCGKDKNYGYPQTPCVFLKLNKIYDWVPDYYDNITDLPEDMPLSLKKSIENLPPSERQQIWVSCHGDHKHDVEKSGNFEFFPRPGFPSYYYPYKNLPGYLSPLIAVQFSTLGRKQLVNVECRAWAKNIRYSSSLRDRQGSVAFQLMIDN